MRIRKTEERRENFKGQGQLGTTAPITIFIERLVYEISSSGMFPLDEPATFSEADKLSFLADAMQTDRYRTDESSEPCGIDVETAGEQPFIRVERGSDFADNLHEDFFPRTFPKLFPWGKGGPKATKDAESRQ
jgi:hypothetical protein